MGALVLKVQDRNVLGGALGKDGMEERMVLLLDIGSCCCEEERWRQKSKGLLHEVTLWDKGSRRYVSALSKSMQLREGGGLCES